MQHTVHQIEFATPLYDELVSLRYNVLREPLGLYYDLSDFEENEWRYLHYGCYDALDRLMAAALWLPRGEGLWQMRQVCVLPEFQSRGIGSLLVSAVERMLLRQHHVREFCLHARSSAVPFYERLGYQCVGDSFDEINIPHWYMKKEPS